MTEPRWHSYLFCGTHGHVVALDKRDGGTVWTASLPRSGYDVVAIVPEDDTLFCASGGRVYALAPETGEILWTNDLEGMGWDLVYLATARSSAREALLALIKAKGDDDAAAASSTGAASS